MTATDPSDRTALAWQRSGSSGVLVAGLAMVAAARTASGWLLLATALLGAGCAVAAGVAAVSGGRAAVSGGQAAVRGGRATQDDQGRSPWLRLLASAAVPALLSVVGLLLALGR